MYGLVDHKERLDFAREHAATLRQTMRAARRNRTRDSETERPTPVRLATGPCAAELQIQRESISWIGRRPA